MPTTRTPHTARGTDAVLAALDDAELAERSDPIDESPHERFYDLSGVDDRVADRVRRAGQLDWLTTDEALDDLAGAVGRDSPFGDDDTDLYDR